MTDRLELLRTFVAIVDGGSISVAAERLNTTQPTVSRRLQQLETYFGLALLERTSQKFSVSEEGQRCYDHARNLLNQWNDLLG